MTAMDLLQLSMAPQACMWWSRVLRAMLTCWLVETKMVVLSAQCETLLAKTHGQLDTWLLVPRGLGGRGGGWIGRAKSRGAHAQPCPTPLLMQKTKGEERVVVAGTG